MGNIDNVAAAIANVFIMTFMFAQCRFSLLDNRFQGSSMLLLYRKIKAIDSHVQPHVVVVVTYRFQGSL